LAAFKKEAYFVTAGFPYEDIKPRPSPRLEN